jgi:hypothetical protein
MASTPVENASRPVPSFFNALRGVWLLTWKGQLTWRRLGAAAVGLLALPVLIYLTTYTPAGWAESHRLQMGKPGGYVNGFSKRVTRLGVPLSAEQLAQLEQLVTEEFQQAERAWEGNATSEPTPEVQRERQQECYDRIAQRARSVLDQRQFTEFQNYQRRHRPPRAEPVRDILWGRAAPFYHCLIDLYFFILLPLTCISKCGALVRDDLEANTLSFFLTRPLSRGQLLVTKFIAQTAWLEIALLAQTLLVFLAAWLRVVPDLRNLLPIFVGAQLLAVLTWSALGSLLGLISRRYMALALLYGLVVEMGIGRIPTNINSLSLVRHLETLLGHNGVLQSVFNWPTANSLRAIVALLVAAVVFLNLATLLFTFREYHHTSEMQK